MQTFLPYPDFEQSAKTLDRARLGKQRVETMQILNTLVGKSKGWANHPAVKMWRGYEVALAVYGMTMCIEWSLRGYDDNMYDHFHNFAATSLAEGADLVQPVWLGNEAFHRSHRANLVRKLPGHYVPLFGQLADEPYVWPVP